MESGGSLLSLFMPDVVICPWINFAGKESKLSGGSKEGGDGGGDGWSISP